MFNPEEFFDRENVEYHTYNTCFSDAGNYFNAYIGQKDGKLIGVIAVNDQYIKVDIEALKWIGEQLAKANELCS